MRVVLDTNTLVSALLSPHGPPRRLLDDARTQAFDLCSSPVLIAELLDVIARKKFAQRLAKAALTPLGVVGEIRRLTVMVSPISVPRVVPNDPDDDHVIACAIAAGDRHLLRLGQYQNIPILKATDALQWLLAEKSP